MLDPEKWLPTVTIKSIKSETIEKLIKIIREEIKVLTESYLV